jgi:hypothetical protein
MQISRKLNAFKAILSLTFGANCLSNDKQAVELLEQFLVSRYPESQKQNVSAAAFALEVEFGGHSGQKAAPSSE